MSVYSAAQEGRLAALKATRDRLSLAIDEAPVTVLPQLTAQLRATLAEIDELDPPKTKQAETGLSEFEERMREREARSSTSARTRSG